MSLEESEYGGPLPGGIPIFSRQSGIYRPLTPHQKRFRRLFTSFPPENSIEGFTLRRQMEMDVAFQISWRNYKERISHYYCIRKKDGSGLQLSSQLRWFWEEYLVRYLEHGLGGFPASFNVMEAFMVTRPRKMPIDLRSEIEHLVDLKDYLNWYTENTFLKPEILISDLLKEGVIYSYDMVGGVANAPIQRQPDMALAGISFIRHEHELTYFLLAGEEVDTRDLPELDIKDMYRPPGKENIAADPSLSKKDAALSGFPGFVKVLIVGRIDLRDGRHDVKYVMRDIGPSFLLNTDDPAIFYGVPECDFDPSKRNMSEKLVDYEDVFSMVLVMIYLPIFVGDGSLRCKDIYVSTELGSCRKGSDLYVSVKNIGIENCITKRCVRCVQVMSDVGGLVDPSFDGLSFESDGYWKLLAPNEIGKDRDGEPVFGRTWVDRHESWTAMNNRSLLEMAGNAEEGCDPGWIYVQRSPSHHPDLYKVGLTRRQVEVRASEISSTTGVPLPFGILARWWVGDCGSIEKEVHRKLAPIRISPRREFFKGDLATICRVVDEVVKQSGK